MSTKARALLIILVIILAVVAVVAVVYNRLRPKGPEPGTVLDEARIAQRTAASFPAADEDYFHDMKFEAPDPNNQNSTLQEQTPSPEQYQSLQNLAKNFNGRSFDLNIPSDRYALKVNMKIGFRRGEPT